MKTLKSLIALLLFLELTACKSSNGEVEGASPLRPAVLQLSVDSSTTWPGLCHRVQVDFTTTSSAPTTAGRVRTVDLTTDLGTLYTNVGCTTSLTTYTVTANTQTFAVYFRSTSSGTASITASGASLTEGATSITVATAAADLVIGQSALNLNTTNFPSRSAQTLNNPYNSTIAAGKFFVSDTFNNRVLIWNSVPTTTQQAADIVLGQPDMTTGTCNTGVLSAQSLCGPTFVHSDGTRLVVSDESNGRVLIWNTIPTVNRQAADVVLGQPDMDSNVDYSASPAANTLYYPGSVFISGTKLFVADAGDNRILIWNTIPTTDQQAADVVVGQADMISNGSGTTSSTLSYPYMVTVHNSKMFVSDYGNSRVLIWNAIPTSNAASANVVVGQPDFTTAGNNTGGLGASSLSDAAGPVVDEQGRFYISDYSNNRVLIWNQIPSANNQAADAVIGQSNFTTGTANTGGVSASSTFNPWGLLVDDGKLWITEFSNHRVLQFTIPY